MTKYIIIIMASVSLFLTGCAEIPNTNHTTAKNKVAHTQTGKHKTFLARITAYWAKGGGTDYNSRRHNGSWVGYGKLRSGHCAVNPKIIPYGSQVILPNGDKMVAGDTGSDVVNRKAARKAGHTPAERAAIVVDKFFETRTQALIWANTQPLFVMVEIVSPTDY